MKISVVVPAYNEARRILPSLERILTYMGAQHPDFELLLVDDGSRDGTAAAVQSHFAHHPALRIVSYASNRGKGYAIRTGALRAHGELVLFTDADLSTPIEELDKMLPLMAQGYDLVIGSRAHTQADIRLHQHFLRERAGKLFNVVVRLVVGLPFHDTQCGFKLFRRDTMQPVLEQLQIDRFAFDVELIAIALVLGLKVAEVPVIWVNSPESTVTLRHGAQAYVHLCRIRRHARRLAATLALSGQRAAAPPPVH